MVDLSNVIVYEQGGIYNNTRIPAPFDIHGNLIPPNLTQTQIDDFVSPVTGQIVFNTTTMAENYYDGSAWQAFSGGSGGITTLTGDVTAGPGSGSQASTLATVNSNVGSFTKASVTVNAKGLVTAASSGSVVLGDLALTSMSTVVGNASNVGSATTILRIDPSHNSVGINSVPDTGGNYSIVADKSINITAGGLSTSGNIYSGDNVLVHVGSFLTVNGSGALNLKPSADSTAGIGFYESDGLTRVATVDTTNAAVSIGASVPSTKAMLDLQSTTKGFLPPRMTNTQRDAISSPPEGLTIYSTSDHALEFYNGTSWKVVATL